jgi:hypothetical protein
MRVNRWRSYNFIFDKAITRDDEPERKLVRGLEKLHSLNGGLEQ